VPMDRICGRCHAARVPRVDSMEAFLEAAAEMVVAELELQAERPKAPESLFGLAGVIQPDAP
jgi:hypothetical protein